MYPRALFFAFPLLARLLWLDIVELDSLVQPNLSFTVAVESYQFFLGVHWPELTLHQPEPSQGSFQYS